MKNFFPILALITLLIPIIMVSQNMENEKYNLLTPEEEYVILNKGTEMPWSGEFVNHTEEGTYTCKRCDAPLFESDDKFDSHCGWPSFDDEIEGALKRVPDADGMRTEIICANCGGHLGHVFEGEGFTPKNTRHCVNSVSMNFVPESQAREPEKEVGRAIFAAGCFWGVEHYFKTLEGVKSTQVGYTGGHVKDPSYEEVCSKTTGHAEALEVVYDPDKITFEELARFFFEIHDPTQVDRQGPDVGEQYRSEIFYIDENQKNISEKLIKILEDKGLDIATKLTPATEFYPAENYHQDYYDKTGGVPYCHTYTKRF